MQIIMVKIIPGFNIIEMEKDNRDNILITNKKLEYLLVIDI